MPYKASKDIIVQTERRDAEPASQEGKINASGKVSEMWCLGHLL